jgi:cyclin B
VSIIDRFLSTKAINRGRLQLLGCASMLLACKYEEIFVPEVNDFVIISDNAYSREQMLGMESLVLNALKFSLTVPSPIRFLEAYLMESSDTFIEPPTPMNSSMIDTNAVRLSPANHKRIDGSGHFLLQMSLQYHTFLKYTPSVLATAAFYHAVRSFDITWTDTMTKITNADFSSPTLRACINEFYEIWKGFKTAKYNSAYRLFSDDKHDNVAIWTNLVQPNF